jgi:hypothetical protein
VSGPMCGFDVDRLQHRQAGPLQELTADNESAANAVD